MVSETNVSIYNSSTQKILVFHVFPNHSSIMWKYIALINFFHCLDSSLLLSIFPFYMLYHFDQPIISHTLYITTPFSTDFHPCTFHMISLHLIPPDVFIPFILVISTVLHNLSNSSLFYTNSDFSTLEFHSHMSLWEKYFFMFLSCSTVDMSFLCTTNFLEIFCNFAKFDVKFRCSSI